MSTTSSTKKRAVRRSAKQWRAIIRRFEKNSLSPADFCRKHDLTVPVFHKWRRKQLAEANAAGFIELQQPTEPLEAQTPWTLELDLPGGGRLRIQSGL